MHAQCLMMALYLLQRSHFQIKTYITIILFFCPSQSLTGYWLTNTIVYYYQISFLWWCHCREQAELPSLSLPLSSVTLLPELMPFFWRKDKNMIYKVCFTSSYRWTQTFIFLSYFLIFLLSKWINFFPYSKTADICPLHRVYIYLWWHRTFINLQLFIWNFIDFNKKKTIYL